MKQREKKNSTKKKNQNSPKHHLPRERADQRHARDGEVDVGRQLAAVVREVDDADGRLGEADDEEVVGVGEEADAGDEDGLWRGWGSVFCFSRVRTVEVEKSRRDERASEGDEVMHAMLLFCVRVLLAVVDQTPFTGSRPSQNV